MNARISTTLVLTVLITAPVWAQPTPVHTHRHGWYAGPALEVTSINGEVAVLTGLRAGWIANRRLTLSLESYRLFNNVEAHRPEGMGYRNTEFFFSGASVAYVIPLTNRLTIEPRALIGGAEAHWRKDFWDGVIGRWHRDDEHTTALVLVPSADLSFALTSWAHAAAGANYRFVTGGESRVLTHDDMNGLAGSVSLRFGRF